MPDAVVSRDRAQDLMRLGWAIAELRGRLYFREKDPGRLVSSPLVRTGHALPLAVERSPDEMLIEIEGLVAALARRTDLRLDGRHMADASGRRPSGACAASDRVLQLARAVPPEHSNPEWASTWNAFTNALYSWDADMQDTLASLSFGESSSYQLGRGLAECSWALDPDAPADSVSGWQHLLGSERCIALTRLLERLTPALPDETVAAIKGSLAAWQRVAKDPVWRSKSDPSASVYLRQQIEMWRDLVVVGISPDTLERKPAGLQQLSSIVVIAKSLWLQLLGGLVSTLVLAGGLWMIAYYGKTSLGGVTVAALGTFGITASSLGARAKKNVNDLQERVRAAVAADELAKSATVLPPMPKGVSVKTPGALSTPGSYAEPITLMKLGESGMAVTDDATSENDPAVTAPRAPARSDDGN